MKSKLAKLTTFCKSAHKNPSITQHADNVDFRYYVQKSSITNFAHCFDI